MEIILSGAYYVMSGRSILAFTLKIYYVEHQFTNPIQIRTADLLPVSAQEAGGKIAVRSLIQGSNSRSTLVSYLVLLAF